MKHVLSRVSLIVLVPSLFTAIACEPIADDDNLLGGYEVSGTIAADTVWTAAMCPIQVTGDVYVNDPANPTLTIEPGCEVRFAEGTGLYVAYTGPGGLMAVGTPDEPIRFTAAVNKTRGSWSGIGIYDQAIDTETRLENVVIEYGGGAYLEANLYIDGAKPTVIGALIQQSEEHGIQMDADAQLAAASTAISAIDNAEFGVSASATNAHTVPEAGSSYTGNGAGAVQVDGGTLETSATWGDVGGAYVVTQDVYVQGSGNPLLTIEAGVTVAFSMDRGLYIAYSSQPGGLEALGTANEPVVFTSASPSPSPGDWSGIGIYPTADDGSTRLENVVVEYGGGAYLDANLMIDGAHPTIIDSAFDFGEQHGIYLDADASFGAGSTGVAAAGNGEFGVSLEAANAGSLPATDSFYAGNTAGGVEVRGGTVAQSATWPAIDASYIVTADVYVNGSSSPVLTLAAGVTLAFTQDHGLYVAYSGAGGLAASGTSGEPVTFTSASWSPSAGAWSGISFGGSTVDGASVLDHIVVEYAGGAYLSAAIEIDSARPTISNATIHSSEEWGIQVQCQAAGQLPTLTNVTYGSGAEANGSGDYTASGC